MVFISLGKIDKNLIPILIGCVFGFLDRFIQRYDGGLLSKNIILTNIFVLISRFLAVIPYIILKIKTKNVNITENKNVNDNIIEYIYIKSREESVRGKMDIYHIFINSLFSSGNNICIYI